ncbi:MAG: hypothetical protein K0R21_1747 [Anaerocolumna sp.]|jgi:hypothetical protein|nr:hypothetical protein [Anaerocolumna sp.]
MVFNIGNCISCITNNKYFEVSQMPKIFISMKGVKLPCLQELLKK